MSNNTREALAALPMLPEPFRLHWINCPFESIGLFTAEQMQAYARAALATQPAQPSATDKRSPLEDCMAILRPVVKGKWPKEQALEELYAYASQPSARRSKDNNGNPAFNPDSDTRLVPSIPDRGNSSGNPAKAVAAQPSAHGEAVACDKWEGAEEWMPLAWELCADECGEEACTELVWEGGPVPEPWGDRWLKYEDEAKRLIALVRKHVPAASAPAAPAQAAPLTDEHISALWMSGWGAYCSRTSFIAIFREAERAHGIKAAP